MSIVKRFLNTKFDSIYTIDAINNGMTLEYVSTDDNHWQKEFIIIHEKDGNLHIQCVVTGANENPEVSTFNYRKVVDVINEDNIELVINCVNDCDFESFYTEDNIIVDHEHTY